MGGLLDKLTLSTGAPDEEARAGDKRDRVDYDAVAQELVVEGYENNHENIRTITWNEREYYYESHRYGDLDGYVTRYEIETIVVPQTWHVVIGIPLR